MPCHPIMPYHHAIPLMPYDAVPEPHLAPLLHLPRIHVTVQYDHRFTTARPGLPLYMTRAPHRAAATCDASGSVWVACTSPTALPSLCAALWLTVPLCAHCPQRITRVLDMAWSRPARLTDWWKPPDARAPSCLYSLLVYDTPLMRRVATPRVRQRINRIPPLAARHHTSRVHRPASRVRSL